MICWEVYICLFLYFDVSFEFLECYCVVGVYYVCINVGMDMNLLNQIFLVFVVFCVWLWVEFGCYLVLSIVVDIEYVCKMGKFVVGFDLEGVLFLLECFEMVVLYCDFGVWQIYFVYNCNNSVVGGCYD